MPRRRTQLKPSTPEEYYALTRRLVKVPSGAVFEIRSLPAKAIIYLRSLLPGVELKGEEDVMNFIADHLDEIIEKVIKPGIVAPQVEDLAFMDAIELFYQLMDLSGLTGEAVESRESFRQESSGAPP